MPVDEGTNKLDLVFLSLPFWQSPAFDILQHAAFYPYNVIGFASMIGKKVILFPTKFGAPHLVQSVLGLPSIQI